jgi:hypothetical protein
VRDWRQAQKADELCSCIGAIVKTLEAYEKGEESSASALSEIDARVAKTALEVTRLNGLTSDEAVEEMMGARKLRALN